MSDLLSILGLAGVAGAKAQTAKLEGQQMKREREQKDLLAELERTTQAEDRALRQRLTNAQIAEIDARRVARETGQGDAAPTFGTGLHIAIDPVTKKRVYVQTSSAGGGRTLEYEPPPDAPPQGPQGSPILGTGPDGQPLFYNPTKRETVAPPPGWRPAGSDRVSAATAMKVAENKAQLRLIDDALMEIDRYPGAIGPKRGIGKVPGLGGIADMVNQTVDPAGVDARLNISNIGSKLIHDRSGAAVSISEFPRLAPFVPEVSDTPDAAKKKLRALRKNLEVVLAELDKGTTLSELGATGVGGAMTPPAGPADVTPFMPPRRTP